MRTDPVKLEIYKNLFHAVAEEMGAALRRTAFSPNIKERRDYSCAVFDARGQVIAMGDHMPVHLGSLPLSVAAALGALRFEEGDIALLNDPFAGGTHLPDITLVMPVFLTGRGLAPSGVEGSRTTGRVFYVASRAHHADVGGAQPGSMGLSRDIYQEGLRLPPVKIAERGRLRRDLLEVILANVRTPVEREGDLTAQVAACRLGARRLEEMVGRYGAAEVRAYTCHLLDYSARMMRATLRRIPPGTYAAEDFLDDDGISTDPVPIRVRVKVRGGQARVDFSGSGAQTAGCVNAVRAITLSAVFYVFRCLVPEETPATAGLLRPIEVITPRRSVVDAEPPAAVAAGNVETSQRIVDTLLRALAKALPERIPAASQGTMNNFTVGGLLLGGAAHLGQGVGGQPFAYYETIAGGMGARATADGLDGIHTHMTNSLNTPIEALESAYPLRVRRYGLRRGSGGAGRHRGGDGIVREIELLTEAQVAILADRRRFAPYGLQGGRPGKPGVNLWIRSNGEVVRLPGKCTLNARAGDVVSIATPGGGGWGRRRAPKARPPRAEKSKIENRNRNGKGSGAMSEKLPRQSGRGSLSEQLTAIPLMQIISGFWASKTLAAAVELELFTKLSGRGVDAQELTRLLGFHPRPAEMLLSGCAALGLLQKREGRYSNSSLAEEFLVRGKPYYFGGVVTMLDRRLYLPWNRLTEALQTNRAQTWGDQPGLFEAISNNPDEQRIFTEAMHSWSTQSGKAVASAFDFSRSVQLLDVGGGSGAYCIEAVRRYPHLRAVVFDIPAALAIAQEKITEAGLGDRIQTHPGDFFREELPKGSDVVLLSMILHDWTPEKNWGILRKCFDALPAGGAVVVSELMMDDDKTGPVSAALMSLNMLIETEGRNYTWAEYTDWLEEVGFQQIRRVPVESPGINGILIGQKP